MFTRPGNTSNRHSLLTRLLRVVGRVEHDMGMGQNPGTPGEPQVIAGIYGCEYPTKNGMYRY